MEGEAISAIQANTDATVAWISTVEGAIISLIGSAAAIYAAVEVALKKISATGRGATQRIKEAIQKRIPS